MVKVDVWKKVVGGDSYQQTEAYINLVFFGGLFRWDKFLIWTTYTHDFTR